MKIDNLLVRVAASMGFVLLGIIASIAFYELTVDWGSISGLFMGLYLYSAYLLFGIICNKPGNKIHRFNTKPSSKNKPSVSRNKIYEY
ncbi:hypothetical protein [Nitrosomonas sp.]|uniref:hypothetical protein n=1 Tax=Nitrosomonas sp. TaxID=42353 RepID=UPI0025F80465|nr:hypothetical protein [Nitrosomonas sp.]